MVRGPGAGHASQFGTGSTRRDSAAGAVDPARPVPMTAQVGGGNGEHDYVADAGFDHLVASGAEVPFAGTIRLNGRNLDVVGAEYSHRVDRHATDHRAMPMRRRPP